MALRDRYMTFDGVNLKTKFGLMYSSFEEDLPEPKVIKVDIPAGLDLDITDALGAVGYHNGKHVLRFLLYGETQAERLEKKRAIVALMHGKRASYKLSWDSGYTYTGRCTVSVEHLFDNADVLILTIDRAPWKVHSQESVDLNCHPTATYVLEGSEKYLNVKVKNRLSGVVVSMTGEATQTLETVGTHTITTEHIGDATVTVRCDDWLMYVDGSNLVVNTDTDLDYWGGVSGGDATISANYTVTNGNMVFPDEADQHQTLYWTRKDL